MKRTVMKFGKFPSFYVKPRLWIESIELCFFTGLEGKRNCEYQ
jgi:hypothetical protein